MKLLIATHNKHKLEEIRAIFKAVEIIGMDAYPAIEPVEEDGDTFEANAIKKAVTVAKATGQWTMADDSGLEVKALGNAPGVYSARYGGEPVSYPANNAKLLAEMKNITDRRARFRCVIAISSPTGEVQTVEGVCTGRIIEEERGRNGFGYDPLFVPEGQTETFAELPADIKNRISHRGKAVEKAIVLWKRIV